MKRIAAVLLMVACGGLAWAQVGAPATAPARVVTVAADGSGDFKTVQEAIASIPDRNAGRTIVHIKPGTYQGQIAVPAVKGAVTFQGENAEKTVLTYGLNVREADPKALPRFLGTGVIVQASDFQAENVTFENSSGNHGQAMALRMDGDRMVLKNCRLLGWQDTLQINGGRQFFDHCYIAGRVDFIYGDATAVFDHCEIHSRNGGHITAASTPQDHPYGFVFFNCKMTGNPTAWDPATTQPGYRPTSAPATTQDAKPVPTDLGRPWRPYASVTYIDCELGEHIRPEGWSIWVGNQNHLTARYAEYHSTGPGANPEKRLDWTHQLTKEQADAITIEKVLGGTDHWNPGNPAGSATGR